MTASTDITNGLRRTLALMQQELDRSVLSNQLLEDSSNSLRMTGEQYSTFANLLNTSKAIINSLERADTLDRLLILAALVLFGLVCAWIIKRRVLDRGLRIFSLASRLIPRASVFQKAFRSLTTDAPSQMIAATNVASSMAIAMSSTISVAIAASQSMTSVPTVSDSMRTEEQSATPIIEAIAEAIMPSQEFQDDSLSEEELPIETMASQPEPTNSIDRLDEDAEILEQSLLTTVAPDAEALAKYTDPQLVQTEAEEARCEPTEGTSADAIGLESALDLSSLDAAEAITEAADIDATETPVDTSHTVGNDASTSPDEPTLASSASPTIISTSLYSLEGEVTTSEEDILTATPSEVLTESALPSPEATSIEILATTQAFPETSDPEHCNSPAAEPLDWFPVDAAEQPQVISRPDDLELDPEDGEQIMGMMDEDGLFTGFPGDEEGDSDFGLDIDDEDQERERRREGEDGEDSEDVRSSKEEEDSASLKEGEGILDDDDDDGMSMSALNSENEMDDRLESALSEGMTARFGQEATQTDLTSESVQTGHDEL